MNPPSWVGDIINLPETHMASWKIIILTWYPKQPIFKWMFGETTMFYVMIWNHPIETTIYKQMFQIPGIGDTSSFPVVFPLSHLHQKKLTWNLKMMVSNFGISLFRGPIFRFHVNFQVCISFTTSFALQEMFQASLADVVGFSAVISSCEKAFQWQASLDLFRCLAGN